MTALRIPAVASGRRVRSWPFLSSKVYISFSTMSVCSPIPRAKTSVLSSMGVLISSRPQPSNIRLAVSSILCRFLASSGSMSLNPFTAFRVTFVSFSTSYLGAILMAQTAPSAKILQDKIIQPLVIELLRGK